MEKSKERLKSRFHEILLAVAVIFSALCLLLFGNTAGSRRYYGLCLVLMVLMMLPFFVRFERRRPEAREIVTVAVMCAIAVFSRVLFIWFPYFKPSTAIIMITGIALGPETGFLCGAVTAFVSNFVFGQGPWTPWQMFAYGIAGLLSGLLCSREKIRNRRVVLGLTGAAIVLCIVGPVLDLSSVLFLTSVPTFSSLTAVCLSGVPANAIHAFSTFVVLVLAAKPMFEKLDRLKKKYGILEVQS